jgi:hypothetical protein
VLRWHPACIAVILHEDDRIVIPLMWRAPADADRRPRPGAPPVWRAPVVGCLVFTAFAATVLPGQSVPVSPVPAETVTDSVRIGPWQVLPLPVLGYAPETRLVGGIGFFGVRSRRDKNPTARPITVGGSATYSFRRQSQANLHLEWWTPDNRVLYEASGRVARFPFRYFGTGRNVPTDAAFYTPELAELTLGTQRRIAPGLYGGLRLFVQNIGLRDVEPGGLLDRSQSVGVRGGQSNTLSGLLTYDTRPSILFPRRGVFVQTALGRAVTPLGGDFRFTRWQGDVRAYRSVGAHGVLAVQTYVETAVGAVPFDRLPMLGGDARLRGNLQGRFRDGAVALAQAEWRSGTRIGRFGATVFGGVGAVASSVRRWQVQRPVTSVGAGLRFLINRLEGWNARVDVSRGSDGNIGTYLAIGEAF